MGNVNALLDYLPRSVNKLDDVLFGARQVNGENYTPAQAALISLGHGLSRYGDDWQRAQARTRQKLTGLFGMDETSQNYRQQADSITQRMRDEARMMRPLAEAFPVATEFGGIPSPSAEERQASAPSIDDMLRYLRGLR